MPLNKETKPNQTNQNVLKLLKIPCLMFKCLLFFSSEWNFFIWKEKPSNIQFGVVSTHAVKIWDDLN